MTNSSPFLQGLIAATFTPFHEDGSIDTETIAPIVDHLVANNVAGLYVLGSTGEGVSLTFEERCTVAEAFVQAAARRLPVIIQCGCESLMQAQQLAAHAQAIGADAISAVSPTYFKPDSVQALVDSMSQVASGAPQLPFYYYHIPSVTGIQANMIDFLSLAGDRIDTLQGIKFTSTNVFEYQSCVEFAEGRYQIFWGLDEMLLAGLSAGAQAAVGSTYNFAAPIYHQLLAAFSAGDIETARRQQSRSQQLVRTFCAYGPRAAQKAIMAMVGPDCGSVRLPVSPLDSSQTDALRNDLESIGFFDWLENSSTGE